MGRIDGRGYKFVLVPNLRTIELDDGIEISQSWWGRNSCYELCSEDKFILCVDKLVDGANSTDAVNTTNIGSNTLPA
jgi:hypothetical protein